VGKNGKTKCQFYHPWLGMVNIYIYIYTTKQKMVIFLGDGKHGIVWPRGNFGYLEITCQCSLWTAGRELWLHQIRLKIMRCSWIHWAPRFSEKCQVIGGRWHSKMLCLHVVSMVLSGVSMCCATSSSSFLVQKSVTRLTLGPPNLGSTSAK